MTIIKSYEELTEFLSNFTFKDIGFIKIQEEERFIEYYKKRRYRPDLYVKFNKKNFESEIYTWDEETRQGNKKVGVFNIRRPDELLFLLTHCLNELRVKQQALEKYKSEIGYHQTNVIPGRLPREC